MKKAINWLLPHPLLSVLLVVVWVLLQNEISSGMVVFAIILGIIIPRVTAAWWPERPQKLRFSKMVSYALIVLWDIIVANIQVGWIVLTRPNSKLRPAWIVVPIDLRQPEAITVLAGTITLTPGTISADICNKGHHLLIHTLDTADPDGVRDEIKDRYERRLKEIFV